MTNNDKVALISNAAKFLFRNRSNLSDIPTAQLENPPNSGRRKEEKITFNEAGFSSSHNMTNPATTTERVKRKV